VVITVRDTGAGISPEILPRVFDLFLQVNHDTSRAPSGLGIGLTLVKRLVEMHGGSVSASSEGPGRGAEFVVRLPLAATQQSVPSDSIPPKHAQSITNRRILVVDDNRDAAQSLKMLLKLQGADAQVAYSGSEALQVMSSFQPEVVFLDIGMPEMDGHEVARLIRQHPEFQDVILIALTGWGQQEDRRRSRLAGFNYHLIKPANLDTVQSLLSTMNEQPTERLAPLNQEKHLRPQQIRP
jgi:CheY-like chemotaxis protein